MRIIGFINCPGTSRIKPNRVNITSYFSVDSAVLQSRAADPEEMLYNLGFGGSDQIAR